MPVSATAITTPDPLRPTALHGRYTDLREASETPVDMIREEKWPVSTGHGSKKIARMQPSIMLHMLRELG